jgi:hypothetical protein
MTATSSRAAGGSWPSAALPSSGKAGEVDDRELVGGPEPAGALDRLRVADRPRKLPAITLAGGRVGAAREQRVRPRQVAVALGSAAMVLVVLVALGGAWVSRQVAQRQAVHDVAELTDVLAQSVLQPALTDAMPDDPTAATAGLDGLVRRSVLSSSLVRVKLWSPDGQVLYSDEAQLIGHTFALDDEARRAITVPQTDASSAIPIGPRTSSSAIRGRCSRYTARCGPRVGIRCCSRRTSATTSSAIAAKVSGGDLPASSQAP